MVWLLCVTPTTPAKWGSSLSLMSLVCGGLVSELLVVFPFFNHWLLLFDLFYAIIDLPFVPGVIHS